MELMDKENIEMKFQTTVSLLLVCLCLTGCTRVFFYPDDHVAITPDKGNLVYEDVYIDGQAGKLHAWWMPAEGEVKGTIIYAHGNAGNMGSHIGFVHWLPQQGYNLFMFDYRGYGRSEGEPTALGIVDDTQRAIEYVQQREDVTGIVLYGHSLGGATGLSALATLENRLGLRGAIIDSAFSNYRDIARDKVASSWLTILLYPFVPLLITGEPQPNELVAKIAPLPVYISHSAGDPVIPYRHGKQLFEQAKQPKFFYELKMKGHNHGWQRAEDRRWLLDSLETLFSAMPPIDPPQ